MHHSQTGCKPQVLCHIQTVLHPSDQVNGDFIEELCKEIETEEFEQIQEKAVAADDEQPIIDWLKEKGMYQNYERINEYLHSILSVIHKRTSKKH